VGGIITPPLLVGAAANDVRTQQFLISSSLIVSGICTVIHCIQLKIPFTGGRVYYGTGVLPAGWGTIELSYYCLQRDVLLLLFRCQAFTYALRICSKYTALPCASMLRCDAAGIISVIGISFTFLPIAQKSIALMQVRPCHNALPSVGTACRNPSSQLSQSSAAVPEN